MDITILSLSEADSLNSQTDRLHGEISTTDWDIYKVFFHVVEKGQMPFQMWENEGISV